MSDSEQTSGIDRFRAACRPSSPLEKSGFAVEPHEEPADWRPQQTALAEGLIAAQAEMSKEMEPATAVGLAEMGRGVLDDMTVRRYVGIVVKKL